MRAELTNGEMEREVVAMDEYGCECRGCSLTVSWWHRAERAEVMLGEWMRLNTFVQWGSGSDMQDEACTQCGRKDSHDEDCIALLTEALLGWSWKVERG